jgi:acetyltransferase-like isoleucine patch superfamily enzyme
MSEPGQDGRTGKAFFAHPKALVETDAIGPGTRVWAFAHILAGASIGSNCNIGDHCFIEGGAVIGDNVTIKNGVSVWANVHVERDAFLGPNCVFTNDPNPRAYIKKGPETLVATRIGAGSSLGANATIVCGHQVGRYAFIGAGAVVVGNVPDFALVVGNPARQIGWMCVCAERLPLSGEVSLGTLCRCEHCGSEFAVAEGGLSLLSDHFRKPAENLSCKSPSLI